MIEGTARVAIVIGHFRRFTQGESGVHQSRIRNHVLALLVVLSSGMGIASACELVTGSKGDRNGSTWIVTDRRIEAAQSFSDDAGALLSYAATSRAMSAKELGEVTKFERTEWLNALRQRLSAAPQDVVLFMHGSGQTFDDAACIATEVSARYNVVVVSLDWAMTGSTKPYAAARARVEGSAARFEPELANLLIEIQAAVPEGRRMSLLAHSMGNYMLQLVTQRLGEEGVGISVSAVVLSAPDVLVDGHSQWLDRLISAGDRVFVLMNKKDNLLNLVSAKGGLGNAIKRKIAGIEGPDIAPRLGFGGELGAQSRDAFYVDVTEAGVGKRHEYYVTSSYSHDPPPAALESLLSAVLAGPRAELDPAHLNLSPAGSLWEIKKPKKFKK